MVTVKDASFINTTVDLDGKLFVRCSFKHCVMRFSGTATFRMTECTSDDGSRLTFGGAATVTVRQFREILRQGGPLEAAVRYYLFDPNAEAVLGH